LLFGRFDIRVSSKYFSLDATCIRINAYFA
jgi:hypothetical protein